MTERVDGEAWPAEAAHLLDCADMAGVQPSEETERSTKLALHQAGELALLMHLQLARL